MNTLTDEETALLAHVENSTTEQIAEELKTLRDGLHQAKEVCNNARLRLPRAIFDLEILLGESALLGGPVSRAHDQIQKTLDDMKDVPENKVTEKQVVQYLEDYAVENKLDNVSIQYTATDKKFPDSRDNLFFYCTNSGHSGQSTRSIKEANTRLVEQMDKQGANR